MSVRRALRTAAVALAGAAVGAGAFAAVRAVGLADPPPSPPAGMVFVPGGATTVGDDAGPPEERPAFTVRVRPFFLDVRPVTVGEFGRFVQATGRITDAERLGGGVYDPRADEWRIVRGAVWHHPLGPDAPAASADHPVTQVSWHDAAAYAGWAGKRLPTELEWEHAARGARNLRRAYAWGDSLVIGGRPRANTWHGAAESGDGHRLTSPVGAFGTTPLGLADMGGNVWQWTSDWFRPYAMRDAPFTPDATSERAQRGGSFLCHRDVCHGYRVSARSHSTPETALFHVGFRLALDVPARLTPRVAAAGGLAVSRERAGTLSDTR